MSVNVIRCNISLTSELLEKIDKACEELGCPRSVYIAMAVKAKLNSDAMMERMPEMMSMIHEMVSMVKRIEDKKDDDGSDGSGSVEP